MTQEVGLENRKSRRQQRSSSSSNSQMKETTYILKYQSYQSHFSPNFPLRNRLGHELDSEINNNNNSNKNLLSSGKTIVENGPWSVATTRLEVQHRSKAPAGLSLRSLFLLWRRGRMCVFLSQDSTGLIYSEWEIGESGPHLNTQKSLDSLNMATGC